MQGYGGVGGNGNNGGRGNELMEREQREDDHHRRRMLMEEKEGEGYGGAGPNAGLLGERGREYDERSPEYMHGGGGGRGLMPHPQHNHPQHVQAIGTAMGHPGGGAYMGPGNGGYGGHVGHPQYAGAGGAGAYGMQQGGGYPPQQQQQQQQRGYDENGTGSFYYVRFV